MSEDGDWVNINSTIPDLSPLVGECCVAQHATGFECTRPPGHTGRHAAGDATNIVAVWP